MTRWTFELPSGVAQGNFDSREQAQRARQADPEFRRIVRGGRLVPVHIGTGQSYGDIPEHFNEGFGEKVRGRRHLKALQKQHGTIDWEPNERVKETMAKRLHIREHGS